MYRIIVYNLFKNAKILYIKNKYYFFFIYRITHTIILEDPYTDPDGLSFPDRSPEPPLEVLQVM